MAKGYQELKIKFSGSALILSGMPQSALFNALIPGGGAWRRLETAYYDGPDGALAAGGLSVRLRTGATETIQIVKAETPPGVFCCREWQAQLPDLALFPAPTGKRVVDQLLRENTARLQTVATIIVDRWQAEFAFKTSQIALAVDLGQIAPAGDSAATPASPLAEIELKLVNGDAADLFRAAKLLLDAFPLRLHARSKRETALLIAEHRQLSIPAIKPMLASADDSAGDILKRSLATVAARIINIQTPILDARAPEGIHRMRVELRRFRAIERVFRRAADCPVLRRQAQQAGVIARALGPARDWDVFIDETLTSIVGNGYAITGFARLKAAAQARRAEAWAGAMATIADSAFSTFALDLLATAHLQPWRAKRLNLPARRFASGALDRTMRKTRKVASTVDPARPESFHPLRIALKKQRYGVQLFRGVYPKKARRPYMEAMVLLQDAFGVLNDAVTAQRLANDVAQGAGAQAMRAAGFICGYYAARAEAAAKEIDGAWAMFEKKRPFWRD